VIIMSGSAVRSGLLAMGVATLMLVTAPAGVLGRDEPADPKRELEQLKRQLEQQRRLQQSAARKERSVLGELEGLDRQIQRHRRDMARVDQQLREQRQELSRLGDAVAVLERTVGELRQTVGVRLRAIYMEGRYGTWGLLLGAGDYRELAMRTDALQRIAAREASWMAGYQQQRAELAAKLRAQQELAGRMRHNRGELAKSLDAISQGRADKRALLAKIRTEQSVAKDAVAELEESAKQLQELLKRLEQEKKRRRGEGQLAQAKGKLPWPGDGRVVGTFGRQRHSQYNTDIFRRGIEIQAAEGASVKAVHQAVVAYADWFKGYGLVVVLDHGDHYYTLYAHLGKVTVKVGEAVEQGQVIGEVGETGLGTDNTLYFELRHHGTPMDPLGWLKRRGKG
jgi:septal ring factor EnvC (AmiA/AmiB activator)